jgi:hypothetical protein
MDNRSQWYETFINPSKAPTVLFIACLLCDNGSVMNFRLHGKLTYALSFQLYWQPYGSHNSRPVTSSALVCLLPILLCWLPSDTVYRHCDIVRSRSAPFCTSIHQCLYSTLSVEQINIVSSKSSECISGHWINETWIADGTWRFTHSNIQHRQSKVHVRSGVLDFRNEKAVITQICTFVSSKTVYMLGAEVFCPSPITCRGIVFVWPPQINW